MIASLLALSYWGHTSPLRYYRSDGQGTFQGYHNGILITHSYDGQTMTTYHNDQEISRQAYTYNPKHEVYHLATAQLLLKNTSSYTYDSDGETVTMVKVHSVPTRFTAYNNAQGGQ